MRTNGLSIGIIFLLIAVVCTTCTKDEILLTSEEESPILKSADVNEYIPGTDITAQLKANLDAGLDVKLPAGHFYTSESIIVEGYSGTVKGAGKDVTIIEAAQGFKASEDPLFPWPGIKLTEMFAFLWSKGDITIKDLTILVTGDAPAETHINPFHGESKVIDNPLVIAGVHEEAESGITVALNNLKIQGEESLDPLSFMGKNMAFPLVVAGSFGAPKPFSATIMNCTVNNGGYMGIECMDFLGGDVLIKNNEILNCNAGIVIINYNDPLTTLGTLTVMENNITNVVWGAVINWYSWSSYCIKNNTWDGELLPDDCQD